MKAYYVLTIFYVCLLGCEAGDKYYIQHTDEVVAQQEDASEEDLFHSEHELPEGALSLNNVAIEEFQGTWVAYTKISEYRKNLDEVIYYGYSARYKHLSVVGKAIAARDCRDHPESVASIWRKTEYHLDDNHSEYFVSGIQRFDAYHYFDDGRLERSYEYLDPFDDTLVQMRTDILIKVSDDPLSNFGTVTIEGGPASLPAVAAVCPSISISDDETSYGVYSDLRFENLETAHVSMQFISRGATGEYTYQRRLDDDLPRMQQDFEVDFYFNSAVLNAFFSTDYPDVLSSVAQIETNSESEFAGSVEVNFEDDLQLNLIMNLNLPPLLAE